MSDLQPTQLTDRFVAAMQMALHYHGEEARKSNPKVPYISHLLSVTALVLQDGGTEDQAIAALLHDAVEDSGGKETLAAIRQQFGENVAEMVLACSDTTKEEKEPWQPRKENHLARLQDASLGVRRIMLADKLHNARSLLRSLREEGEQVWQSFKGRRAGTLWYFRSMWETLGRGEPGYLADELKRVIDQIEELSP